MTKNLVFKLIPTCDMFGQFHRLNVVERGFDRECDRGGREKIENNKGCPRKEDCTHILSISTTCWEARGRKGGILRCVR